MHRRNSTTSDSCLQERRSIGPAVHALLLVMVTVGVGDGPIAVCATPDTLPAIRNPLVEPRTGSGRASWSTWSATTIEAPLPSPVISLGRSSGLVAGMPSGAGKVPSYRDIEAPLPGNAQARSAGGEVLADGEFDPVAGFRAWWVDDVVRAQRSASPSRAITLEGLVIGALGHSPQIRSIGYLPLAQEPRVIEAQSEFDLRAFVESTFDRPSDPVTSTLTTGGPPRFREQHWSTVAGVRQKTTRGGMFELSQRLGYQNNNSTFFVPSEQGNSRLVLSFTQPLLRGAGRPYNTSWTVLAQIDASVAWDQFSASLQEHLVQVTRNYWQLYLHRAVLLQKRNLQAQALSILSELEGRRAIDATESQIIRLRAAATARRAELARAEQNIRNAEARIRAQVGDPKLSGRHDPELVPLCHPSTSFFKADLRQSRRTALWHRPEMNEAIRRVRAGGIRLNISRKDLLPVLDFVMETYVSGIAGEGDFGEAFSNQFSKGEPGYSVGLKFEVPFGGREAQARHRRRNLELRQLTAQLDSVAATLTAEVDIAVGEVDMSYRETRGKYHAMTAAEEEAAHLHKRWRLLAGDSRAASLLLEDLLRAQERLAAAQASFAQSQVNHTMSLVELKRATGTLLQHERITYRRKGKSTGIELEFDKAATHLQAKVPRRANEESTPAR